jgi:multiple antibiotic resistance protein
MFDTQLFEGTLSVAQYVKIFVAMVVIVNPLGLIPVFVTMTVSNSDRERKRIARIAAQTVAVVLIISTLLGERVLEVFGISIASFKVGGAILIMINAIAMMQAAPPREKQTPEEAEEAVVKASIAVVPLGIPLLAGPGAMSTIVIYASEKKTLMHLGFVILVVIALALVTWLALRIATRVGRYMSVTTLNVATRIMGLLLAALAVEIFASGIQELIPALGKPDVFRYGQ